MPRRPEAPFPPPESQEKVFSNLHFIDEQADNLKYHNFTFEFCTLEKIGMKGVHFSQCNFRHCEFIDCYLAHAEFEHCKLSGSFFDRCVFSWAKFQNTGLDYTNFSDCGPVLSQIQDQKPRDPQAAAKLFRNLAAEHKKLGNWEEVDRYTIQSYRERERHFKYVVNRHNDHYRKRYNSSDRIRYAFRLAGHKIAGSLFGYGISWAIFLRTIFLLCLLVFPLINFIFINSDTIFDWSDSKSGDILKYVKEVYVITLRSFMPFIPISTESDYGLYLPFILSSLGAVFGTTMMAVFAALLFRWASKGN